MARFRRLRRKLAERKHKWFRTAGGELFYKGEVLTLGDTKIRITGITKDGKHLKGVDLSVKGPFMTNVMLPAYYPIRGGKVEKEELPPTIGQKKWLEKKEKELKKKVKK